MRDSRWMRIGIIVAVLGLLGCDSLLELLPGQNSPPPAPPAPIASPTLAPQQPMQPMQPMQPVTETGSKPPIEATAPGTPPEPTGFTIPGTDIQLPPIPGLEVPTLEPRPAPARGTLPVAIRASHDARGSISKAYQSQRARQLHGLLLSGLFPNDRRRIAAIPFEVIEQATVPNAAAICYRGQRARMVITTALLTMCAGVAEALAFDEIAGTHHYEGYLDQVTQALRQGQALPAPGRNLLTSITALDSHKLARQQHLFDQQIAFIIAHEFAHHYRGHSGCLQAEADQTEREVLELQRQLSNRIRPVNQAIEVEADQWAVTNVLQVNHNQPGLQWSEEGAVINVQFLGSLSNRDLPAMFLSTHPPSILRATLIQDAARRFQPGQPPTTLSGLIADAERNRR